MANSNNRELLVEIHDFDSCIKQLTNLYKKQEDTIKSQASTINRLESENYKDSLVKELNERLDKAQEDYRRGFPIAKDEQVRAEEWKNAHEREKHWDADRNMPLGAGSIGGRYSYIFTPTSVGVLGTIKCNACGEELFFSNI